MRNMDLCRNLDNCESLHNEYKTWRNFLENHCSLHSETERFVFYFLQADRLYQVNKKTGNINVLTRKQFSVRLREIMEVGMTDQEILNFVENRAVKMEWVESLDSGYWNVYFDLAGRHKVSGVTFRETVEKAKREFDRIAAEMV